VGFDGATREIGEPRRVLVGGPHRRHRLERMGGEDSIDGSEVEGGVAARYLYLGDIAR
jgi:hypothetical protein